jgi:hypothetical protein
MVLSLCFIPIIGDITCQRPFESGVRQAFKVADLLEYRGKDRL